MDAFFHFFMDEFGKEFLLLLAADVGGNGKGTVHIDRGFGFAVFLRLECGGKGIARSVVFHRKAEGCFVEGADGAAERFVAALGVDADGVGAMEIDVDGRTKPRDAAEIIGNGHHADIRHQLAQKGRFQHIGIDEDIRGFGSAEVDGNKTIAGDMVVVTKEEATAVAHGFEDLFVFHGDAENSFAIDKGDETSAVKENAAQDFGAGVVADPAVIVG